MIYQTNQKYNKMTNQELIIDLEAKAKATDNKYKRASIRRKIRELKAIEAGHFVTKAHLTEHKGLIIWAYKKESKFNTQANMVACMKEMLAYYESNKIPYTSPSDLKSELVSKMTRLADVQNTDLRLAEFGGSRLNQADRLRADK